MSEEKKNTFLKLIAELVDKLLALFFAPSQVAKLVELSTVPKLGEKSKDVGLLQLAIKNKGFEITVDDDFGPKTRDVLAAYQKSVGLTGTGIIPSKDGGETFKKLGLKLVKRDGKTDVPPVIPGSNPVNPAYVEAKKHKGKKETDSVFNKWLSGFWKIVGLSGYKTIIGTSFAWCGLFIAAMNSEAGLEWIKNGAGARNWAKYGVEVEWKKNGIPRGAVIHINSNCGSGSGNHVTFADGDCTAEYLAKSGSTVPGFGGNQSNTVKRSAYAVSKICAVRWPKEIPLPKKITKNVNCDKETDKGETTR